MTTTRAVPAEAARTCGGGSGTTATRRPEELLADLAVIRRSLEAQPRRTGSPAGALAALERRVELFGFHLAKLDVRLHASEVRGADRAHARASSTAVAAARAPARRRRRSTR